MLDFYKYLGCNCFTASGRNYSSQSFLPLHHYSNIILKVVHVYQFVAYIRTMASIVTFHSITRFPYFLSITHKTLSLHRLFPQCFSHSLTCSTQSGVNPLTTRWHSSSTHQRIPTPLIQSQLCQKRLCPHLATLPPRSVSTAIATTHSFHTTLPRQGDYHFDTLKLVQRLREEGFTEEQSVAMMKVLSDVIEER